MTQTKHLFLSLNYQSFSEKNFIEQIVNNLKVPARNFPRSFFLYTPEFVCAGYFVSYDQSLNEDKIINLCQKNKWRELVLRPADLFIVYADNKNRSIKVVTGQNGTFPCFYSTVNNTLSISPDFKSVVDNINKKTLNETACLDLITACQLLAPPIKTVFNEVHQLPPSSLLSITETGVNVSSLISHEDVSMFPGEEFKDVDSFFVDFKKTFLEVMEGYSKSVANIPFACDASSGFDCTLVNYFLCKVLGPNFDTYMWNAPNCGENLEAAQDFCDMYKIPMHLIDISGLYPFSTDIDINWSKERLYPADNAQGKYLSCLSNSPLKEIPIIFTGHGGDEMYGSALLADHDKFGPQKNFFMTVGDLNWGLAEVFNQHGLDLRFDKNRFVEMSNFPLPMSSSALAVENLYYSINWETNHWFLLPLTDQRLIQICKRIPKQFQGMSKKQELLKHSGLFSKKQFIAKDGPENLVKKFIVEKNDFIIAILENSILGKRGLIKTDSIISDLKNKRFGKLCDKMVYLYILALVQVELFLQNNPAD